MNQPTKKEFDATLDEIRSRESRDKAVLAQLLDTYANKKGVFFAVKSEMGVALSASGHEYLVPSFVIGHSLDWIGMNVKMGAEMPFMQGYIDENGRLAVDESNAEDVKQRSPDWTRQPAIAAYLAHDPNRKFGTILAVINPPWVDDPAHENWGPDGRAIKSAAQYEALDSSGRIGLLDLDESLVYALDGQHRVMGIRGIQAIQGEGKLQYKRKDGRGKSTVITKEEFMQEFNLDITKLQSLLSESLTVEYVPAVVAGETREQAARRVRSAFVTINSFAKRTDKGENVLLNESDGYAIVGRKAGTLHSLFKGDRVNWKNTSLPKRTHWYTTLQALKDMATGYLKATDADRAVAWEPKFRGQVPVRPDEQEIRKAKDEFFEFLDQIAQLPVFVGLESGDALDAVREFPLDGNSPEHGHLLLRPIGQTILARAVGSLVADSGLSLGEIFKKLAKYDKKKGFEAHRPENVWYGVTYNPIKKSMNVKHQTLAIELLEYLVRGAEEAERKELLARLVEARTVEEGKWTDFSGKTVAIDLNRASMPTPIK